MSRVEDIQIYAVEPSSSHRDRFIVAVDVTGSTRALTALAAIGKEDVFFGWVRGLYERLLLNECEYIRGGFEVANFTGDGFIVLCDQPEAVWGVLFDMSPPAAKELLTTAAREGLAPARIEPFRMRRAVTYGSVYEIVLRAMRNAAPAELREFMSDAYKEPDEDTLDKLCSPMLPARTERAHMGSEIVRACRLLSTQLARECYGILVHKTAYDRLCADPYSAGQLMSYTECMVDTADTRGERVWCFDRYDRVGHSSRSGQDQPAPPETVDS